MHHSFDELTVSLAGHPAVPIWDKVSRYCGLPWSGGPPEVWAFRYYDTIPMSIDDTVTPTDVAAAAVLHPGLSRADLAFFVENNAQLAAWLREIPSDVPMHHLSDDTIRHIVSLAGWPGVSMSLLSKVLHRKRPLAIPLLDRHVIDLYRPITGLRNAAEAFPAIVRELRNDFERGAFDVLESAANEVGRQTGITSSALRLADIVIWTGAAT